MPYAVVFFLCVAVLNAAQDSAFASQNQAPRCKLPALCCWCWVYAGLRVIAICCHVAIFHRSEGQSVLLLFFSESDFLRSVSQTKRKAKAFPMRFCRAERRLINLANLQGRATNGNLLSITRIIIFRMFLLLYLVRLEFRLVFFNECANIPLFPFFLFWDIHWAWRFCHEHNSGTSNERDLVLQNER